MITLQSDCNKAAKCGLSPGGCRLDVGRVCPLEDFIVTHLCSGTSLSVHSVVHVHFSFCFSCFLVPPKAARFSPEEMVWVVVVGCECVGLFPQDADMLL